MKIHTIGGYNEVGKNMTALETGDDVILFDDGLFMPAIVGLAEREKVPTERGMRAIGALPDDLYLDSNNLREKVRAILISHAHLDHVGALQNNAYYIKGKKSYKVEFINMTHSTLHSTLIAVHTPNGIIAYANDFKLDNSPVFGDKPNYKRLKELSRIGVKSLIVDSLYSNDDRKTPSEKIAKGLLEDVFFSTDNRNSGMIVTTFSSHIARLKTIAELGDKLNRKVIILGRSMNKYVTAANNIGKAPFMRHVQMLSFRKQIDKVLKKVNQNKSNYLILCTGHQGEPGSILDRISRNRAAL